MDRRGEGGESTPPEDNESRPAASLTAAERLHRLQIAAWAYGELLDCLGTATDPNRENPEAIAHYSRLIDDAQEGNRNEHRSDPRPEA